MSTLNTSSKAFEPGTTGWTASDLDDPAIEREWFRGRYEIVEGVLTKTPPAYFTGGEALVNLVLAVREHALKHGPKGSFAAGVDIVIDEPRVVVADAVFLTSEQRGRQEEATERQGRVDLRRTRILVPPMLIIESISPGHELHDRQTKFRWYGEFGVQNYWIMDAYQRRLDCFILDRGAYRLDCGGNGADEIKPAAFPGLGLSLRSVWSE